jgi:hypothetical protein
MPVSDSYYWKLLDAYLEDFFVDHADGKDKLTEQEVEDLVNNPEWIGIRCHHQ